MRVAARVGRAAGVRHATNGDRRVKPSADAGRQGVIGSGRRNVIGGWAVALLVVGGPGVAQTVDVPALARAKKCMNCHALDQKLVGPAYKAVAARYAADKDAEDRLVKKILEGGSGTWGVVPMPVNDVTEPQARQLAHWILLQK